MCAGHTYGSKGHLEGNTKGSSIVVQLLHDHIEGSTCKTYFNLLIHGNVREDAHQGVT